MSNSQEVRKSTRIVVPFKLTADQEWNIDHPLDNLL